MKIQMALIILMLTLLPITASSQDTPYTVRIVYFQPTDAPPLKDDLVEILLEIQEQYRKYMKMNGHGARSFKLERNENNEIVTHTVKGKKRAVNYRNVSSRIILGEFPEKLRSSQNVFVIVIGKLAKYQEKEGVGFPIFGGSRCNKNYGGYALVAERTDNLKMAIAHNLGHAFGLYHNKIDSKHKLMGKQNNFVLDGYETRWLHNHHYFREDHDFDCAPRVKEFIEIQYLPQNRVQLFAIIIDQDALDYAQLIRVSNLTVIAWSLIEGKKDTMQFAPDLNDILQEERLAVQMMDKNGNYRQFVIGFELPPKPEPNPKESLGIKHSDIKINKWADLKKPDQ